MHDIHVLWVCTTKKSQKFPTNRQRSFPWLHIMVVKNFQIGFIWICCRCMYLCTQEKTHKNHLRTDRVRFLGSLLWSARYLRSGCAPGSLVPNWRARNAFNEDMHAKYEWARIHTYIHMHKHTHKLYVYTYTHACSTHMERKTPLLDWVRTLAAQKTAYTYFSFTLESLQALSFRLHTIRGKWPSNGWNEGENDVLFSSSSDTAWVCCSCSLLQTKKT
jgi:hypothetical protein